MNIKTLRCWCFAWFPYVLFHTLFILFSNVWTKLVAFCWPPASPQTPCSKPPGSKPPVRKPCRHWPDGSSGTRGSHKHMKIIKSNMTEYMKFGARDRVMGPEIGKSVENCTINMKILQLCTFALFLCVFHTLFIWFSHVWANLLIFFLASCKPPNCRLQASRIQASGSKPPVQKPCKYWLDASSWKRGSHEHMEIM